MRVKDTESFINKARDIHGDKYDYSKVEYKDYYTKVCIICSEHGEFWQTPYQHLHAKAGCKECGKMRSKKSSQEKKLTFEQFVLKTKMLYNGKYEYSKSGYKNLITKISVLCPKHGEFYVTPYNHLHGQECPICTQESLLEKRKQGFINKAKQMYGNEYDYSKVNYVNYHTPVCIISKEYGEFWQKPINHLNGKVGCSIPRIIYTYDYCYNIALKYKSLYEFRKNDYRVYAKSQKKNWLNDYTWLEDDTEKIKMQTIYVYEFSDNSAYVGLTNDIVRRDFQHRHRQYHSNGDERRDGVLDYSISNNIEIPEVKILKENLTKKESQIEEQRFIKFYRKNGWNMINKNKGGSLGGNVNNVVWSKESIIEEAKKYKNKDQMRKYSRTAYNKMMNMNLSKICFPDAIIIDTTNMKNKYTYTDDFLNQMKIKYPLKQDLRKNESRVYHWLQKNKRLYEFYPENVCYPNGKEKRLSYTDDFLNQMKIKYPLLSDLRHNNVRTYNWLVKHKRLNEFYPNESV